MSEHSQEARHIRKAAEPPTAMQYIERGALIEFAKHQWCESCREAGEDGNGIVCRACVVAYVIEKIEDTPAADVVAVKHGRWLGLHDGWYYSYSCSECGAEALTKEETMHDQVCSNYCPNCGAKMDGE